MEPQPSQTKKGTHMKTVLRALLSRGKYTLLAVVAVLTLSSASVALAGSGVNGVFNLGVTNTVNALTTLVSGAAGVGPAGPLLRIDNNSTNAAATALELLVEPGKAPMKTNSGTKVTNLNADQVDGKDQSAFVPASRVPMWVIVNTNGTIARKSPEVVSASRPAIGFYVITFNRNVDQCAYAATIYPPQRGFINAGIGSGNLKQVLVETTAPTQAFQDTTFHLIVTC
jgi:hypothetical protein